MRRRNNSFQSHSSFLTYLTTTPIQDDPATLDTPYFDTKSLFRKQPRRYVVRVYVLQGWDFVSSGTDDITGRKKQPKPYLKVSIGEDNAQTTGLTDYQVIRVDKGELKRLKKKIEIAKEGLAAAAEDAKAEEKKKLESLQKRLAKMQDTNSMCYGFYTHFDIPTTLPSTTKGRGMLEISVLDHHSSESDTVIGSTKIDLLDRFYSTSWQRLGLNNKVEVKIKNVTGQTGTVLYGELDKLVHKFSKTKNGWKLEEEDEDGAIIQYENGDGIMLEHGETCAQCSAKQNPLCSPLRGGFQCYCMQIGFLQQAHQRYATKPVEDRPLTVPTSKLPRGGLQIWVDIMLKDEAKKHVPSYYLPENYVKGLFERAVSRKKEFENFGVDDIVDSIEKLSDINRASVFFGKCKGNSIIRQCIAFKNYRLLEYFLKKKPLAAFVKHHRDRDSEEAMNRRANNDGEEDDYLDSDGDDEEMGGEEESDDDSASEEEEEEEEEGGGEGEAEEDIMEGGGLEEDHVAGDAGEVEVEDKSEGKGKEGAAAEGQTRARGVEKTNSRHEEVQGQVGKYVDCFDYALRIKDYEVIRIMAEIVCKPLVEQFGYLPGKMTKLLRRLMHRNYHELVGTILASIPLAVEGENDPRKTNVLLTTPLCDLGTLSFLTQLAEKSDTSVFDTDIVALVVEKLWEDHIRMKFMKGEGRRG